MNSLARLYAFLAAIRLGWLLPLIRLCRREDPAAQARLIAQQIGLPLLAAALFLLLWSKAVEKMPATSLGAIPGPGEVWQAFGDLRAEARMERLRERHHQARQLQRLLARPATAEPVAEVLRRRAGLSEAQIAQLEGAAIPVRFSEEAARRALLEPAGGGAPVSLGEIGAAFGKVQRAFAGDEAVRVRQYGGRPTFYTQIRESLGTVFVGFLFASAIAIPLGILCGLSRHFYSAINLFIQIFKPVSPLAWLPIVTLAVVAFYQPSSGGLEISFIVSAIVVALCSLWPTLVNTAVGVSSLDPDHLNVARVLKLGWGSRLFKIILPASLPLMFTGLRISLGVGWMVLIAAEMLAQNPGLGKFVWDMFQNGSSETLAMIVVAVFAIGIIGFLLDTVMGALQALVTFEDKAA